MTKEEYEIAKNSFIKEQYRKEPIKPSGMCGHWSWYLKQERKFNKSLKDKGIIIE